MGAAPAYKARFACPTCGTGYLDCAQLWTRNLKCCRACDHPGRWTTAEPYTQTEINDMRRRAEN